MAKPIGGGTGGKKPAAAPQVEEADLGEGLSKEEAIEKVEGFYSAESMAHFKTQKVTITNEEDGTTSTENKDPTW